MAARSGAWPRAATGNPPSTARPNRSSTPTFTRLKFNTRGPPWSSRLYECYVRAVWLDPADPDHLILGPADGVGSRGRIGKTCDGGRTWQPASTGLKVPWRRHMVERFTQVGGELLAVLSNGELLAAPLATLAWRRILPDVKDVAAVAALG